MTPDEEEDIEEVVATVMDVAFLKSFFIAVGKTETVDPLGRRFK